MDELKNVHPGEILEKDFLEPLGLTAYALAKAIGVDQTRISQLIKAKRSITADTSIRFSKFFKMSAEFWLNAQSRYDLMEKMKHIEDYKKIEPFEAV